MGSFRRVAICLLIMLSFGAPGIAQETPLGRWPFHPGPVTA